MALGLASFQCGCDGSRPCAEPDNDCVPARLVPCSECEDSGTELCLLGFLPLSAGCWFALVHPLARVESMGVQISAT